MNIIPSIIAVHGFGSNVDWSWTWKGSKPGTCVNWLKDLDMLPKIIPKSRIMVYNYILSGICMPRRPVFSFVVNI